MALQSPYRADRERILLHRGLPPDAGRPGHDAAHPALTLAIARPGSDGSGNPERCLRPVRGDRRPGLQEDIPRSALDVAPGEPALHGGRGVARWIEPGAPARAGP